MVFTRSKARQQAREDAQSVPTDTETPEPSRGAVVKRTANSARKTKTAVIRISPVTSPVKQPPFTPRTKNRTTPTEEETIDKLALKALRAMKAAQFGMTSSEIQPESLGTESEEESQPSVMTLEPISERSAVSAQAGRPDMLATTLKPSVEETLYFSYSRKKGISRVAAGGKTSTTWGEGEEELMKKSVVTPDFEKKEAAPPMYVSKYARARARKVSPQSCIFYSGKALFYCTAKTLTSKVLLSAPKHHAKRHIYYVR